MTLIQPRSLSPEQTIVLLRSFQKGLFYAELNRLGLLCHSISVDHGWYDEQRSFGDRIALMHSELSEALEAYRSGNPPSDKINAPAVAEELADLLIRLADFCYANQIDLADAVVKKMWHNKDRSHRHGGKLL